MDWRCLFKLRLFNVERNRFKGKVCVGNLLTGVFLVIAILVDHLRPALCDFDPNQYKPILCADLSQVTGNRVHHPVRLQMV